MFLAGSSQTIMGKIENPREQTMSKSARTIFIFGLYLGFLGIVLLVTPNLLLGIFQLPSTNEVWIRVVGMLLFLLGIYYILAARKEMTEFFQ